MLEICQRRCVAMKETLLQNEIMDLDQLAAFTCIAMCAR